jgi:prepilin-type N-terminal cleavage/methylation domain-containing protein
MVKRTTKPLRTDKRGFTLIEVILYITIFAMIIGAIAGLTIPTVSQRQKNEVITAVNYQGEAVLSLMSQSVHQASSINAPSLGASSSALSLVMPTQSVNPTIFSSYNDGATTHLEISQGNPAVNSYLTNSHVILSNLTFNNLGLSGTKGSILISFTLSYTSSSPLEEFSYQKTFSGASSIP